jgi:putative endonuclease
MNFTYILASNKNGTLYIGVTNNLIRRVYEHKSKIIKGFTQKHGIGLLVYYEIYDGILEAIAAEKKLKHLTRKRKIEIIERDNPNWEDLYYRLG